MFRMEFETDGAAFKDPVTGEDDALAEAMEITRILNEVMRAMRNGAKSGTVVDINGNRIGQWLM